jgi:hypothetical protein
VLHERKERLASREGNSVFLGKMLPDFYQFLMDVEQSYDLDHFNGQLGLVSL